MKKYISNAFSFNMMNTVETVLIKAKPISPEEIPANVESVIGHEDTARMVSKAMRRFVPAVRATVKLELSDTLYLAQYKGPRLPEGCTNLPEGATLEFLELTFQSTCQGCQSSNCDMCGGVAWMHH